jgi:hypothetical protein
MSQFLMVKIENLLVALTLRLPISFRQSRQLLIVLSDKPVSVAALFLPKTN